VDPWPPLSHGLQGIPLHPAGQGQQLPIRLESRLVLPGVENLQTPFPGRPLMIPPSVPRRGVQRLAGLEQSGDDPDAVHQPGGIGGMMDQGFNHGGIYPHGRKEPLSCPE